jgi:hypothetical protein
MWVSFQPDWLKKIPPMTPIRPNSGQGMWIRTGAQAECLACHTELVIPLPVEKQKARYSFFGDEPFRNVEDRKVLTYSLAGTNRVRLPEVENAIRDFKSRLYPSVSPDSWRLHMTDIWPEYARKRHPIFREWDSDFIEDFAERFFELIRGFDDAFVIYNISGIYYPSKDKKRQRLERKQTRLEAYSMLLVTVIYAATKDRIQPSFVFDSEKDSEANNVIHSWAQDAFYGSRLNLLHAFLARGLEIPEPMFVRPGSRPCLEVADFVSYVVARYCFRKLKNQPIDLDPELLGPVYYLAFVPDGDVVTSMSTGYPWEHFYGST